MHSIGVVALAVFNSAVLGITELCEEHGGKPMSYFNFWNKRMLGFELVRRVAKGNRWHPATDNLRGTDEYGTPPTDPVHGLTGTIKWDYSRVQYFMFSTGDFSEWYVVGALHWSV